MLAFTKIGYGTKKMLKAHVSFLYENGVDAKVKEDGNTYSYKKNRSLVVPQSQERHARRLIVMWEKKNPNTPTPYINF